jgi:hypothetical protein
MSPSEDNSAYLAIKQSDFLMPFSQTLLYERKDDYNVNSAFAPYTIMAFNSTEEAKTKLLLQFVHMIKHVDRKQLEMNGIRLTTSSINWSYFILI